MSLRVIIALIFIALLVVLLFIAFRSQSNKRLALTKDKMPNLPAEDTSAQRQTLYESSLQQEDKPENKNNNKNDKTSSIDSIANAVNIAGIKAKTTKQTKTKKADSESTKSHIAKNQTAKPNKAKQKIPTEPVQPTLVSSETTAKLDTSNNTNTDTIDTGVEVEANTTARPTEAKTADINQVHTDTPLISEADIADILGNTVSNTTATNSNKTQTSKQTQIQTQIPEQNQEQIQSKVNTKRLSAIPSQPKPDTSAIKIQNHDERQTTADKHKHQAEIKAKAQTAQDKKQVEQHAQVQQKQQKKKEQAQQQQQTKALNVDTQNIDTKTQTIDTKADSTPEVTSVTVPAVTNTETTTEAGAETAMQPFAFVEDIDSAQLTLDLAQQYLEVGEYDSAKRLLQEVLSPEIAGIHASAEQKSTANDLLQRLY